MRICFDMDGTIADLYRVSNWLENLIAEASLHISALTPDGAKIHVEQVGRAIHIECSRRNPVFLVVGTLFIAIACAGEYKEKMFCTHSRLQVLDEFRQLTVNPDIRILQFHLTF